MIKLYFHPSPNPLKIALYLEEVGEPYELIPVDTRKGEQHTETFKAINPNAKTFAMLDGDALGKLPRVKRLLDETNERIKTTEA